MWETILMWIFLSCDKKFCVCDECVICLQRIYNFLLFHAIILSILDVFYALLCHYCKMLPTRHYDQRPFDETMCDALITNGDVKNHQKRYKTFAMVDTSNTVQILVVRAMLGI